MTGSQILRKTESFRKVLFRIIIFLKYIPTIHYGIHYSTQALQHGANFSLIPCSKI